MKIELKYSCLMGFVLRRRCLRGLLPSLVLIISHSSIIAQEDFWEQTNGPYGGSVLSLVVHPDGDIFAGTFDGGVFRSANNGDNWVAVNTGLTNFRIHALVVQANGDIFAGTYDGVFRSNDRGDSWTQVNTGLNNTRIRSFAIHDNGDIFAGTLGGVFRSSDNGDIFAGTNGGGIFRSNNNGGNWIPANTGLPNTEIHSLAFDPRGYIFVGASAGLVFRSANHGDSWAQVNSGLPSRRVRSLAINAIGSIFAATEDGVFRSVDSGDSWFEVNSGLTNIDVNTFAIHANDVIFAGTDGSGVFRSAGTTTNDFPVTSFELHQNFPNPFNSSTVIRFVLPSESRVTITVYNLLGEEVATLADGELRFAGYHLVAWDGVNTTGQPAPSGIYLYQLQAEGLTIAKKMALVR